MSTTPYSEHLLAQDFEESLARQVETGIRGHRLDDDRRNLAATRHEKRAQRRDVIEGERNRQTPQRPSAHPRCRVARE